MSVRLDGEIGHALARPECVLAHASGLLFASDWAGDGGVAAILPDGRVHRIAATRFDDASLPRPLRPNGIALEPGGRFLLAHLGEKAGGVFRLHPDGAVEPAVTGADGAPLPPTNFVVVDARGRLWITVSTRRVPRADDYRANAASGFVALAEPGAADARIVADRLGYTNECSVDLEAGTLHVNETFGRRLTRFALAADGTLSAPETLARFGEGSYPDGLAPQADGAFLVTSIISNRVLRVEPDGRVETLVEDSDPTHVARAEAAYRADALGREHLDRAPGTRLRNVSSLAFAGADLRTAYLGNLLGESLPRLALDRPGRPPPHWRVPLGPLAELLGAEGERWR